MGCFEEKPKKKYKSLLVLTPYPEVTKERYGEQIEEACFGICDFTTFDEVDCDVIASHDVILVHLIHMPDQIDILPAMTNMGLVIGMSTVTKLFLIEDDDLCHGYDERITSTIRKVIDGLEKLSNCDIVINLNETDDPIFFDKLGDEFTPPVRIHGIYTDNEEYIKKKFNKLSGGHVDDKDTINRYIPIDQNCIGNLPKLTRGYIYSVWYGKYSRVVFKPKEDQADSDEFRGRNNRTIIVRTDKGIHIYVWIKPSNDVDMHQLLLLDDLRIDACTTGIVGLKQYLAYVKETNAHRLSKDIIKVSAFVSKLFDSYDLDMITRVLANKVQIESVYIKTHPYVNNDDATLMVDIIIPTGIEAEILE